MERALQRSAGRLGSRVAVVTGAGGGSGGMGIGQSIALTLAAAGAHVHVVDRDGTAAAFTVELIRSRGGSATPIVADVTDQASVTRAFERLDGLDVLVNNAAVLGEAPDLDAELQEFVRTLEVNLVGAIRVTKAAAPLLRPGGAVTFVSSLGAERTFAKLDYEASKGAINSAIRALAVELGARDVRVNAVSPGQVWTPMSSRRLVGLGLSPDDIREHRRQRAEGVPIRREGSPWDIASAVLFLSSEDAEWITGENLRVDGGQSGVVGYLPERREDPSRKERE